MSNVLIGIIGVILFIGLALAGALFLGPRFQDSSNTSKAAAVVQNMMQVNSASAMFTANEGFEPHAGFLEQELVGKSYLKIRPPGVSYVDQDGNGDGTAPARFTRYIMTEDQVPVCRAVNQQLLGSQTIPSVAVPTADRIACVRLNADWGATPSGTLLAIGRL